MPNLNEDEEPKVTFPADEVEDTTEETTTVEEATTEAEPAVNIKDFDNILGTNLSKDEPKKEEEVGLKEEKDDEEETLPLPGVEEPPKAKVESKKVRDYSFLPEAERERLSKIYEKTGNEAYEQIKTLYKSLDEVKRQVEEQKKLPKGTSVYGHPRSYVLTKEHDELVTNVQAAGQVERHWQTQLARIRRGEKWVDMDVDPKTGNFVYSEPKDATAEDEVNVNTWLNDASAQRNNVQQQYRTFVSSYETGYKSDLERWQRGLEEFLPASKDPQYKKLEEELIEKWVPPSFRDHPVARAIPYLILELAKERQKNKVEGKESKRAEAIRKTESKAPPTKKAIGPAASSGTGISFSAFKARMQEA